MDKRNRKMKKAIKKLVTMLQEKDWQLLNLQNDLLQLKGIDNYWKRRQTDWNNTLFHKDKLIKELQIKLMQYDENYVFEIQDRINGINKES